MHQHPSNRAAFLAGLTLAAVLPQAVAGTLRIETAIGPALAPQGGSYDFTIRNEGTGPLDAVRSFAGHGHVVVCDALTRLGRSFTPAGDLDGGDSVHCSLAATGHRAAEWHREAGANAAGGLALVTSVVPAGAAAGNALAELTQARPTPPGEVGQSPATVACRWQGLYQRLARWRR